MKPDIRTHLTAHPFVPFVIVMSSGQRYPVPTAEHAGISPESQRVFVWLDDGSGIALSSLHITAIEREIRLP